MLSFGLLFCLAAITLETLGELDQAWTATFGLSSCDSIRIELIALTTLAHLILSPWSILNDFGGA